MCVSMMVLTACSGEQQQQALPQPSPQPVMGISYPVWAADGYDRPENAVHVAQIADIGANWISLTITWYQDELGSSCPAPGPQTVSLEGIERVAAPARSAGLEVAIKPMVDLPDDTYRGEIEPDDVEQWFDCYATLMGEVAQVGDRSGAGMIIVGTELISLERHEQNWRALIAQLRDEFAGTLTYSANYTDLDTIGFWDDLDFIGVSAYWPLADRPTDDVDLLVAGWQPHVQALEAMARSWDREILLTEVGYRSVHGAVVAPWDWQSDLEADQAEQAAAFEATRAAWSGSQHFAGLLVWAWDDLSDAGDDQATDYTPRAKVAELVIYNWFSDTLSG